MEGVLSIDRDAQRPTRTGLSQDLARLIGDHLGVGEGNQIGRALGRIARLVTRRELVDHHASGGGIPAPGVPCQLAAVRSRLAVAKVDRRGVTEHRWRVSWKRPHQLPVDHGLKLRQDVLDGDRLGTSKFSRGQPHSQIGRDEVSKLRQGRHAVAPLVRVGRAEGVEKNRQGSGVGHGGQ